MSILFLVLKIIPEISSQGAHTAGINRSTRFASLVSLRCNLVEHWVEPLHQAQELKKLMGNQVSVGG